MGRVFCNCSALTISAKFSSALPRDKNTSSCSSGKVSLEPMDRETIGGRGLNKRF